MRFWLNPEFVRHVRAELRPARALTAAMLALVICFLVGLSSWAATERNNPHAFFQVFYLWTMGIQFVVLTFWCASACGHAISREREMKTYDFLRTTRLTAIELMVGKVLGVPVLAYFTVGCSVPVSIVLGIWAGYPLVLIVWTYVLLVALALFVSLMGLLGSIQLEGASARSAGLVPLIPVALGYVFINSPFPGLGAISVFPALISFYGTHTDMALVTPTLFGIPNSFGLLTLILYFLFGAWFVLMLTRNLKKDLEQIRLLSRWQAIGFATFLNVLFYALLDPNKLGTSSPYNSLSPQEVSSLAVFVNAAILLAVGVAMLSPHEKLKVWWRKHAAGEERYISESGPLWPWLFPAALAAYGLLVAEALGLRASFPLNQWHLGITAVQLFACLVFVTRDVLFLQWASLTGMKRPVVKGLLYLCLYYVAAGIVVAVVSIVSTGQGRFWIGVLTPYAVFAPQGVEPNALPGIYVGVLTQAAFIVLLLRGIEMRLRRPAIVPTIS